VTNFYCATCHNLSPSLTITMNDGDQYFEKKIIFMSKNLHSADGWQSMTLTWHHNSIIRELHNSLKWVILMELQLVASYIRWIATHATCPLTFTSYKYSELQVSFTIQKLSCKASYKTPFFPRIVMIHLEFYILIWNIFWNLHNTFII
jgi:hypothetical protein